MEGPDDDGHIQPTKGFIKEEEENMPGMSKRKMKVQREEKDGRTAVSGSAKKTQKPADGRKADLPDLSKKDLLHLLGIMEGEVQAREDIIGLLKVDTTRPETLEAHYGSSTPTKPLQALQRDALLTRSNNSTEDVYEKPMAEVSEGNAAGSGLV